jgi:hypothetical protein
VLEGRALASLSVTNLKLQGATSPREVSSEERPASQAVEVSLVVVLVADLRRLPLPAEVSSETTMLPPLEPVGDSSGARTRQLKPPQHLRHRQRQHLAVSSAAAAAAAPSVLNLPSHPATRLELLLPPQQSPFSL